MMRTQLLHINHVEWPKAAQREHRYPPGVVRTHSPFLRTTQREGKRGGRPFRSRERDDDNRFLDERLESPDPSKKSKFVRFSTPTETILRERLSSFRKEYKDPDGESDDAVLVVKALSNEWIDSCADLLTESFADSMGYMSVYKKFLRNQIGEYLNNHVRLLPKTVILVGIIPRSAIGDGQEDILAGTVEISFSSSTRTKHLTLNPPQDMPYLCNMAVQPEQRGKGYGRLLLDAAEQLILSTGYTDVFLHVRHEDPPALSLYRTSGFVEEGEDWSIIQVFGLDRRYLMRKSLAKK
mmetsp:Transcript_8495/g.17006  ORF Transcript_8495/g.17006 Transcript_8495/m.17006 type:complete len:295 (-) Transcript_8495:495-1379(-)